MDWLHHIEADGRRIHGLARTHADAAVPACDGWTVAGLVGHLGLIHQRAAYLCRTGDMARPSQKGGQLEPPPADGVVDWAAAWLDEMLARFRATDPDAEMYSFFPGGGTAGWWQRRMAHETAVHRVDVEQAAGEPVRPVDADLAIDGVDEVLEVFLPTFGPRPFGAGETLHLHATDAEGEWNLTLGADAVDVERGHGKGDAAVRGTASSLYLWLWGRQDLPSLEVFGDASVAASLRTAVSRSTA